MQLERWVAIWVDTEAVLEVESEMSNEVESVFEAEAGEWRLVDRVPLWVLLEGHFLPDGPEVKHK